MDVLRRSKRTRNRTTNRLARRRRTFETCERRDLLASVAANFDGQGSYLSSIVANPLIGADQFTLEAWVKKDDKDWGGAVITSGQDSTFWFGVLHDDRLYFRTGLPNIAYASPPLIDTTAWTHIAVSYRHQGITSLFVNGQVVASDLTHEPLPSLDTRLTIGAAPISTGQIHDPFRGGLAEVRIWDRYRSDIEIRQSMTVELEERRPGLVANYHLNGNTTDAITETAANILGNVQFVLHTPPAPPTRSLARVDDAFAQASEPISAAGTAYIPSLDEAIVTGGIRSGQVSSSLLAISAATGRERVLGQLANPRAFAAATFVPSTNKVYAFGGLHGDLFTATDDVTEIDPFTGTVRALPPLPFPVHDSVAVFHPQWNRVYLFGGYTDGGQATRQIMIFDVATGQTTMAPFSLPNDRGASTGVYSATQNAIYLFGGSSIDRNLAGNFPGAISNQILRIDTSADRGTVRDLAPRRLPIPLMGATAAVDSATQLVYLVGGLSDGTTGPPATVWVFDPETERLSETSSDQPRSSLALGGLQHASVFYSERQRHLLQIGGNPSYLDGSGLTRIVRYPLGDGPVVPIDHWDFPLTFVQSGERIYDIDGDDQRVVLGTATQGLITIEQSNAQTGLQQQVTTPSELGAANLSVTDVSIHPTNGASVLSVGTPGPAGTFNGAGARIVTPTSITSVDATRPGFGTNVVRDTLADVNGTIFYATDRGVKWRPPGAPNSFASSFSTSNHFSLANRGRSDEVWSLAIIGAGEFRRAVLYRMIYGSQGFLREEYFELPDVDAQPLTLNEGGQQLVFDEYGNFWIRRDKHVTVIPAGELPNNAASFSFIPEQGLPSDIDAGGDGRVWLAQLAIGRSAADVLSGGLSAFEKSPSRVDSSTGSWHSTNSPLATSDIVRYADAGGMHPSSVWDASIQSVASVDEKVWAIRDDGTIVTFAQRWGQLSESNSLAHSHVDHVWTVNGRLFVATRSRQDNTPTLSILQPDGKTWDNRSNIAALAVMSDRGGRVWVGTEDGIWWYRATGGWDTPSSTGTATTPRGPIRALAEDQAGRVWIASDAGITLFDRGRFVTTLTSANSGLPNGIVRSLVVARDNTLWLGTDAGLASWQETRVTRFTTANGLPHNRVDDLIQLPTGAIAVSTPDGLAFVDGPVVTREFLPSGINTNSPPLALDEFGRLWAGNAVRMGNGEWQGFWATNSGLRTSNVVDVVSDRAGRVWFAHGAAGGVSVRSNFLPPLPDTIPVVTSVTPAAASSRQIVTIQGGGFGESIHDVEVTIGGQRLIPLSVTNDQIRVVIGDTTTSGNISVARKGRRTFANTSFCAIPVVNSFSPTGGSNGVQVEVWGTNFDPGANIRLGNGSFRQADTNSLRSDGTVTNHSATHLKTIIETADTDGSLVVRNPCGQTSVPRPGFNHVTEFRSEIQVNQGYRGLPLVANKPTAVSSFLTATDWNGNAGDRVEIDTIGVRFTLPDGRSHLVTKSHSPDARRESESLGATLTTEEAIMASNVYTSFTGAVSVQTELSRRGILVAKSPSRTVFIQPNRDLTILLVPFMKEGYSANDLANFKIDVLARTYEFQRRIMPQGQVHLVWADEVATRSEGQDIGNDDQFDWAKYTLQRIRNKYNDDRVTNRSEIAMGMVHPNLTAGIDQTAGGKAVRRVDPAKKLANAVLDSLCDAANDVARTISFGLIGDPDGCNLESPIGVGWVNTAESNLSFILGHEVGHTFELVDDDALNGDPDHNKGHSKNDEFYSVSDCKSYPGDGLNYDRTLYAQVGVNQPILNPISGTPFIIDDTPDPHDSHAKAIMSYACGMGDANVFFEPFDLAALGFSVTPFFINAAGQPARSTTPVAATPAPWPRLNIAGDIDLATRTGVLQEIHRLSVHSPVTLEIRSDYSIVQLDSAGRVLDRLQIDPLETRTGGHHGHGEATAFFSVNIARHPDLARIELRYRDQVLDRFAPGSQVPTVQIISPVGGVLTNDFVDVVWQATDPDGDLLDAIIEASNDRGATWKSVGSGDATGTVRVPANILGGGAWEFRVTISDGLSAGVATSNRVTIPNQVPTARIITVGGIRSTEGHPIHLVGVASDPEHTVTTMTWHSDRDGLLGLGDSLDVHLSVGAHRITLTTVDAEGRSATATTDRVVLPDYDGDGLTDDVEFGLQLNPLLGHDAFNDQDGDGLSEIAEILRGSARNRFDSDGDGRSDGDEVRNGASPLKVDAPRASEILAVEPSTLELHADLELDIPLPQDQLAIVWQSATPRSWTVTSDAPWLVTSPIVGVFPSSGMTTSHVLTRPFDLADGVHTGTITVRGRSSQPGFSDLVQQIPVSLTVTNRRAHFDVNQDGQTNAADQAAIQQSLGMNASHPNFNYRLDVNRDGQITTADTELLTQATARPTIADIDRLMVAIRLNDATRDITGDGKTDLRDLAHLVKDQAQSHFGDANLDGVFNSGDLIEVFQRGEYEDRLALNSGWADGDWNADGEFDSGDLVAAFQDGGYTRDAQLRFDSIAAAIHAWLAESDRERNG